MLGCNHLTIWGIDIGAGMCIYICVYIYIGNLYEYILCVYICVCV